jgi:hypothetical protein
LLSDVSIFNILKKHKITRKRLRSRYYPEKKLGQEKQDLKNFYKQLNKYNYKKTISIDETSIYLNMTSNYGRSEPNNYNLHIITYFYWHLKHYIRKYSPQNYKEIVKTIKYVIKNKIKKIHLENYFKHSYQIFN